MLFLENIVCHFCSISECKYSQHRPQQQWQDEVEGARPETAAALPRLGYKIGITLLRSPVRGLAEIMIFIFSGGILLFVPVLSFRPHK